MSRSRSIIVGLPRALVRVFFRQIEVTGLENVPEQAGGLLVAWHPNGLIDGAMVLTSFPSQIVIGARHGLFNWPILGQLMGQLGAVPIYRKKDMKKGSSDDERRAANRRSIDAMAQAVADGSFAALFPEGISHDEPFLRELKTGAAHLYYRAVELTKEGTPRPVVLPVGLHYNKKTLFGSQALVAFHPPLDLSADLAEPGAGEKERLEQARRLTAEIERELEEVVLATESWEVHDLLNRTRKLIRAERASRAGAILAAPDMVERVWHFGQVWANYRKGVESYPERVENLIAGVTRYDEDLKALAIEDHELDGTPWLRSKRRAFMLLLQTVLVYFVLPPFLVIGVLVNLPTALLLMAVTKAASDKYKDEATLKLLLGAVAFPITWLIIAVLVGWGQTSLAAIYPEIRGAPVVTGSIAFLLSAFGGLLALQYRRFAAETLRAVRVHYTLSRRGRKVDRLLAERGRLFDQLMELKQQLLDDFELEHGSATT